MRFGEGTARNECEEVAWRLITRTLQLFTKIIRLDPTHKPDSRDWAVGE